MSTTPDDMYIDTPIGAIDITQIATWTVIIVLSGVVTAVALRYIGKVR